MSVVAAFILLTHSRDFKWIYSLTFSRGSKLIQLLKFLLYVLMVQRDSTQ